MSQEQGYFIRPRLAIDRDFGIHRNAWVRDQRIVGNPLSIYLYLLSHDPGFQITLESARKGLGLGKDAFITARRTLEVAGYLRMVKVTHPAGTVDANGRSIGGRVLRYDIEVLDPEPPPFGPASAIARPSAPVDNSLGDQGSEIENRAENAQKPWSNPVTGFPVADDPVPDDPLPDNPPLKENQEDQENQSSSSTEVTTEATAADSEAAALPPDDDGELGGGGGDSAALVDDRLGGCTPSASPGTAPAVAVTPVLAESDPPVRGSSDAGRKSGRGPNAGRALSSDLGVVEGEPPAGDQHEPVDLQRLLRAGIEVSLRELDSRLNLSEILRRLSDAGVNGERVDVPAAAAFVLSAAARPVGDPSAYVAAAIIREPSRWPWHALPSTGVPAGRPGRSTCELQGHRYLDEFRMQCVRCHQERPGWREERYAADSGGAHQARPVAS